MTLHNSLIAKISHDLCLKQDYISDIINNSNRYYKHYTIPKKNGSLRSIYQASPELKSLQYWITKNILIHLPVSQSGTFAYKIGDSIKKHAIHHKNSKFLFHTDIKSFFPSTKSSFLLEIIKRNKHTLINNNLFFDDIDFVIKNVCFRYDKLTIGTVSSPYISNIILYDFDEYMIKYTNDNDLIYSRYADDIYISSQKYLEKKVFTHVQQKLQEFNYDLNLNKTWFQSKKYCQKVTGIVLTTDGKISIGTNNKKELKKRIYKCLKKRDGNPQEILGYLAFLKDIEPLTYNKFISKYSSYCDGDIIEVIKNTNLKTH